MFWRFEPDTIGMNPPIRWDLWSMMQEVIVKIALQITQILFFINTGES